MQNNETTTSEFLGQFKSGIENKTEHRIEHLSILRKKKKEEKFARLRYEKTNNNNKQTFEFSELAPLNDNLNLIYQFFLIASNDNLNQNLIKIFPNLFDNNSCKEIDILIEYLNAGIYDPDTVKKAIQCIFILSQADLEAIVQFTFCLLRNPKFLEYCIKHITTKSVIYVDVWKSIANIASVCEESRNIIMKSDIFQNLFPVEFKRLTPNSELQPVLYCFICAIIVTGNKTIPDESFIKAVWPYLLNTIKRIQPVILTQSIDDNEFEQTGYIINCLFHISALYPTTTFFNSLIQFAETNTPILSFLVKFVKGATPLNRQRITFFLNQVASLGNESFNKTMYESGCLKLMSVFCCDGIKKVAIFAIKWMTNFVSSSMDNVLRIIDEQCFLPILTILRLGGRDYDILYECVNMIFTILETCILSLNNYNKKAEQVIEYIAIESYVLKYTTSYIQKFDSRITCKILSLWILLLKWNKPFILQLLLKYNAMDNIDELVASNNTQVYKLACQIQSYNDEANKMDDGSGEEDHQTFTF
jgi:hypothetical protein